MEGLRERISLEHDLQKDGLAPRGSLHLLNVAARYALDQDLDNDSSSAIDYDLDSATRDRLIAHARQDASLAVGVAHSTARIVLTVKRVLILVLLIQCVILWRIW